MAQTSFSPYLANFRLGGKREVDDGEGDDDCDCDSDVDDAPRPAEAVEKLAEDWVCMETRQERKDTVDDAPSKRDRMTNDAEDMGETGVRCPRFRPRLARLKQRPR